ncbi:hypothetical protein EV368DRAFT_65985 [Lentinula lateritia]|nr:hypothetical protein EV368DRAFT_65985 [Lentinula lateritia]
MLLSNAPRADVEVHKYYPLRYDEACDKSLLLSILAVIDLALGNVISIAATTSSQQTSVQTEVNLREACATGGMGLQGITEGNTGPDGFFRQGSGFVAVSNVTNMLVAVNWPTSVTFNKAGDIVCGSNGGEVNGVRYTVFPYTKLPGSSGQHHPLPGINQTTPAAGPTNTVSQILFSSDSSKLLVAYSGTTPTAPGYLAY